MKIKNITFLYNEEALVPFYLKHYHWVDEILAIVTPGTDRTVELLQADPRVTVEMFDFPNGLDDIRKMDKCNQSWQADHSGSDWQFVVDVDELCWPPGDINPTYHSVRRYLADVPPQYEFLVMKPWNVFRHVTDTDLNVNTTPVVSQRRHGEPDRYKGAFYSICNKPCIKRTAANISFTPGCHFVFKTNFNDTPIDHNAPYHFDGAHWSMADPSFCIKRCTKDRAERLSQNDIDRGLASHFIGLTAEKALQQCKDRENSPICF